MVGRIGDAARANDASQGEGQRNPDRFVHVHVEAPE
jgi:hypothetical protein